jgi:basic membrane protein A
MEGFIMNMEIDSQTRLRRLFYLIAAFVIAIGMVAVMLYAAQEMPVRADPVNVGLVLEYPENSPWNSLSYQGLMRAETDLGVIGTVYTTTSEEDYSPKLQACVLDGNELCISVGFTTQGAISATASINTATNFAIVDVPFDPPQQNLRAINFRVNEPSYLAGTLTGLMTQSDVLGVIGGMEIPGVTIFIDGFTQGAMCANPDVTQLVTYTNNFVDPALGANVAQNMIQQGADVIFPPAGSTGNGAILTATQSSAWAIGFDTDQYNTLFMSGTITGSEYLLTSVIKKLDNAVYQTIADQVNGVFTPGYVGYGLAEDAVGLAPFHDAEEAIPDEYKGRLAWLEQGIISGTVDVSTDCPSQIFLPFLTRNE